MTETPISAGQFLACLKQQVPVSSQIKAANQLDASSLSENEQKQIADALRTFAGTKNGPMLIMGLPGPLQALLSFSGGQKCRTLLYMFYCISLSLGRR